MNQFSVSGRITADPIIRDTRSGGKLAVFSVADNRRWTNADGSAGESVTYFNCVAFQENFPENLNASLSKGDWVNVTGRLEADDYEADMEDGRRLVRRGLKVIVATVGPDLRYQSALVERNVRQDAAPATEPTSTDTPAQVPAQPVLVAAGEEPF
jgi:single stranded DNA-binding protein